MEPTESAKVAQTKRLIATQFELMLDRKCFKLISVNDICKRTMISRSTFYLHFKDKYELLKYCLDEELNRCGTAFNKDGKEDFIDFTLNSVLAKRNLYYNAFFREPTNELLNIIRGSFYRLFYGHLTGKQAEGVEIPEPVSIVAAFYSGAILNSIEQWFHEELTTTREELADCQRKLMPKWML